MPFIVGYANYLMCIFLSIYENIKNCYSRIGLYLEINNISAASYHFPLVLLNRLNKTESVVFLYCRFFLFLEDSFFPDYLEVATAVVVPRGVGKTSPRRSI